MTSHPSFSGSSLLIPSLLAISLALTAGCSSKSPKARYQAANTGSACYAKAVPSAGEGGLAWGNSLSIARQKSLNNCIRYAGRSGGTPHTCKVVLAECK
ncbi:hypothetical protein KC131_25130 [Pseudomonas sp. JQ170]|uniref:hypothetical protein n=1 Tax=unclassified Pseudomonas TaxID=196821 RepID=UPI000FAE7D87|nr:MULTISPECIES: hypothetical protein [unclassified Pseudomonas]MDN7143933.1 hypothetical protein [Pseudomonas sp. JQ170]WRO78359.1 hypothetical protein U9R80_12040 [Pseudomonas sp. 170C]